MRTISSPSAAAMEALRALAADPALDGGWRPALVSLAGGAFPAEPAGGDDPLAPARALLAKGDFLGVQDAVATARGDLRADAGDAEVGPGK